MFTDFFIFRNNQKGGEKMTNKPKQRLRVGNIIISKWDNTDETNGKAILHPIYTISKTYSLRGEQKYSHSFSESDLYNIARAIESLITFDKF